MSTYIYALVQKNENIWREQPRRSPELSSRIFASLLWYFAKLNRFKDI